MEDADWLETGSAIAAAHQPPAELSGGQLVQADIEEPSKHRLALLTVPPDFSISAPAAVASPTSQAPPHASGQSLTTRRTGTLAPNHGQSRKRAYKVNGSVVEFDITVQLDGSLVGMAPLKIGPDRNVAVQLTGLLVLLRDRIDPQLHDWLGSAYGVNSHISFEQLRSAGIDVRYDAANDVVVMTTK
jgi:hypothetical protein